MAQYLRLTRCSRSASSASIGLTPPLWAVMVMFEIGQVSRALLRVLADNEFPRDLE